MTAIIKDIMMVKCAPILKMADTKMVVAKKGAKAKIAKSWYAQRTNTSVPHFQILAT